MNWNYTHAYNVLEIHPQIKYKHKCIKYAVWYAAKWDGMIDKMSNKLI